MRFTHFSGSLSITLLIFVASACQNNKPAPVPNLQEIDLLRGDFISCGGDGFGQVNFEFICKNSMRSTFNLGISLLHSFEYEEAEKAFTKVIDEDPNCSMAYWGVAMSIYHALWGAPTAKELDKGSKLISVAETLPKTKREQEYLSAIAAFYKNWEEVPHKTRARDMEIRMEKIYKDYPDDDEAAIFYALALNSTADPTDKTYMNRKKAGKILEAIFPEQPNHPGIAHYIIHNYDNPELAQFALPVARKYAQIAPSSAHAQHMPSHIFTRLGLWDESIQSNLNSASSARCYAEQSEMEGNWTNELHALDYLFYAYLQKGDNKNAHELYQYFDQIKIVSGNNASLSYPFAAIPARMVLENKEWSKAADLDLHNVEMAWEKFPWEKSIHHFARALGASHLGDLPLAEDELNTLKLLQEELSNIDDQYKANQVMIQIKATQAWIEYAKGNNELALRLMIESADMENKTEKHPVTPGEVLPARELLGDLLIELNKPSEALIAYEESIDINPNRFNGIYGAAVAASKSGDETKARMYFNNLITLTEGTESDRVELEEAKIYLSKI